VGTLSGTPRVSRTEAQATQHPSRIVGAVATDLGTRRTHALHQATPSLIQDLVAKRGLIWAFAQRDFRTRYRTSAVGWTWSLIQPLANLAVFAVVFSVVFTARAPELGSGGGSSYALYLFTGFVAWNTFAQLLNLSMASLRESGSLLRKVAFPAWAPVLGSALVQMIQVCLELSVMVVWYVVIGNVGWTWFYVPFLLLALALFSQAVGLLLSTANARYGDVQYIVGVVLSALYFLTPVLYPVSAIPASAAWLKAFVQYQPVSWYVQALHAALYSLDGPGVLVTGLLLLVGVVAFLGALWVFDRTTEDVGEIL
jgi:ABC-type polysaccharide/polyol phosphate export permease